MRNKGIKILSVFLIVLAVILIAAAVYINSLLPIITGYAAKNLCSAVFISGREQSEMESSDLNFSFIKFNKNRVDFEDKSVTSKFLWGKSKAIYREGFGVTLLRDINEEDLLNVVFPKGSGPKYNQDTISWPLGNIITDTLGGINRELLDTITEKLVNKNFYRGNIYAFLVMNKGIPVVEAYKTEFNEDTRFLSWSMAKSFICTMAGILVGQGKLDVNKPVDIKSWKNDERSRITLNDLLRMQSGLDWNEDYGNRSDVTVMLHCESDMGKYAYEQKAKYQPGSNWYYSSGTTNIVCDLIQHQFNNDSLYYLFARNELFNKIGMQDAVLEVDPSGSFVGSSYLYATARDYARFALMYLNDGIFNDQRILPEGWVNYCTTETVGSDGKYGAFFWLNKSGRIKSAPEDMFSCNGHDGQYIFMIPSKQLAVIILGYSPDGIDLDRLFEDLLRAV
ncbi:MAG TPA: serine hydrolase domain-containing protein [Bacteroidales bacterium]|nr:serine hydrolase domain-containing protein [Bacteroidales bacterium]